MATFCPHCHQPLKASELEEKFEVPAGCVCNPKEWGDPEHIPLICGEFDPMPAPNDNLCCNCEHEKACHDAQHTQGRDQHERQ